MNETKIRRLLNRWTTIIEVGELSSRVKASNLDGGVDGRIRRTHGSSVIFDAIHHADQRAVQDDLCKELPGFSDVIRSEPELMDGHAWIRRDFIFLYFSHFKLVVEKIRRFISKSTAV